ncbi:uncharacterized protein EI90DRAFT_1016571 [Cantharellus anzutake]|uniref:uncharacterized protein n=1 Tax=Cantharellus anzutake TaxID=1750568 RepID=UPI0019033354|nr:uncharacterized protein EI90DRAFT_1016571 [Cantharellus anzutake]KAF8331384.1 hypothetical protein EI90DRAFT_1016571 [Cantharellus anzutake]
MEAVPVYVVSNSQLHNGLTKVPDRGSDIWAFGCVSVQILIDEPPYSNLTDDQIPIAAANMKPYEWRGLEEFEKCIVMCFAYPPYRRISIDSVCDTFELCLAEETRAETSEMSIRSRQGGYVHRSGFSASGEKNDSTLKIRTPDAQQLVRPEQTTGSGAFVDVDLELHSERDASTLLPNPEQGFRTHRLIQNNIEFGPVRPVILLNSVAQRFQIRYTWNDTVRKNTNHALIYESRLHIIGSVFSGQGPRKGYARDAAAYQFFEAYPHYYH